MHQYNGIVLLAKMADQSEEQRHEKIAIDLLMKNNQNIDKFQTVVFIIGGIISGVLGLTSWKGAVLYALLTVIVVTILMLKTGLKLSMYTDQSLLGLATNGLTNYAMSFVLFWTLSYALVHIY